MKNKFAFLLFLLSPLFSYAQSGIADSLDILLNDDIFLSSDASLVVYDLTDDSLIYSHRASKIVRPASVQKVLTSVVALDNLGKDYTIDTHLLRDTLCGAGNIYVKGRMDPLFDESDIIAMAQTVPQGAVIDTLFADCSFCDSLYWGPGWSWDDTPYSFQPYISPLMLCGGAVEVVVRPSARGEAPTYSCVPQSSFYIVINEAECGNQELGKLTVMRDWLDNSNVIRITGNCTAEKKVGINMYKSADFFVAVLLEKLDSMGVVVNNVAFSTAPDSCEVLFELKRPITEVIDEALLESNNLCAESLLYHLGARNNEGTVSMEQGCTVVNKFIINKLGFTGGYSVADGSGLSLYNYLTADILMATLKYANSRPRIFSDFYSSLPLSGVSGTLKNRTKNSFAYKKVRAKTGTVKGVCTLAGYANASNGHRYAFVILNSGLQSSRPMREWQDKVCNILCR